MLNCIEWLYEIELEDDDGPLRRLTLMYILKTPSQAILDRSTPKKTILITVDASEDHFLEMISQ